MTRDDIIRLAQEAGVPMEYSFNNGATVWDLHPSLERFATLVAAAAREEVSQEVRGFFASAAYDQRNLGLGYLKVSINDVDDLADSICKQRGET